MFRLRTPPPLVAFGVSGSDERPVETTAASVSVGWAAEPDRKTACSDIDLLGEIVSQAGQSVIP